MGLTCGLLSATWSYATDEVDFGLDEETFVEDATNVESSVVDENVAIIKSTASDAVDKVEKVGADVKNEVENAADAIGDKVEEVEHKVEEAVKSIDAEQIISGETVDSSETKVVIDDNQAVNGVDVGKDKTAEKEIDEVAVPTNEEVTIITDITEDKEGNVAAESEKAVENEGEIEQGISYYVQKLNLSEEQLDLAKYISDDSRLKQEQLLKSIALLRKQARDLEAKSLEEFEAILTDEQREEFLKLREVYEKKHHKEIPDLENLSDAASKLGE